MALILNRDKDGIMKSHMCVYRYRLYSIAVGQGKRQGCVEKSTSMIDTEGGVEKGARTCCMVSMGNKQD